MAQKGRGGAAALAAALASMGLALASMEASQFNAEAKVEAKVKPTRHGTMGRHRAMARAIRATAAIMEDTTQTGSGRGRGRGFGTRPSSRHPYKSAARAWKKAISMNESETLRLSATRRPHQHS